MYCRKCGNHLDENYNFCNKCGTKYTADADTKVEKKVETNIVSTPKKEKNDDPAKVILIVGVFLVLFASFLFGIISWENLSSIFKISFFGVECLLFYLFSAILRKIESKLCRLFFIIGSILVPYTLSLIPYYNLFPEFFSNEAGIYIYLALCYVITGVIYILTNISFKSKFLEFLIYIDFALDIFFISKIFGLNISIIIFYELLYLTGLYFYSIFKKNILMRVFYYIGLSLAVIGSVISISFFIENKIDDIFNIINIVYIVLSISYIVGSSNRDELGALLIFPQYALSIYYICFKYVENKYFLIIYAVAILVMYIINSLQKNKIFKYFSLAFSYITLVFLFILSYNTLQYSLYSNLCVSLAILLLNIYVLIKDRLKVINYIIPLNILFTVLSVSKLYYKIETIYLFIGCSVVYMFIYLLLKAFKNKYDKTYFISALISLFLCFFNFRLGYNIPNMIILGLSAVFFLQALVFKEHKALEIISYVLFNIGTILFFNDLYYSVLFLSIFTIIFTALDEIMIKENMKGYYIYSLVLIILSVFVTSGIDYISIINSLYTSIYKPVEFFSSNSYPAYILVINLVSYILGYIVLYKKLNHFVFRRIYTIIGLFLINNIICLLIEPVLLSSIVSILAIIIIIISLFLGEIEDKVGATIISLPVLISFYRIIALEYSSLYDLYLFPLIVYTILLTEIINFKDKENKKVATLVPLTVITVFSFMLSIIAQNITISIVYNLIVGSIYVAIGAYRKYNYLIYLGIIVVLGLIFFKLFSIMNSVIAVITLIVIGFAFITIASILEINKKK